MSFLGHRIGLAFVTGSFVSLACAQVLDTQALLNRLAVNQVIEADGYVYVRVQDQRRGATQALERILIGRASVLASYWLCQLTPQSHQRLDANLQGINLIHSREENGVMDVVIKLKKQKPECTVQTIPVRPEPAVVLPQPSSPVESEISESRAQSEQRPSKATSTMEPSGAGFKVRVYSTEH
jgi:hypothetical protein